MGLKKLVNRGHLGQCVQVPYEWHDYMLFLPRLVLFLGLTVVVLVAVNIARFLNWLASHPRVQLFDRRGRK